MSEDFVSVADVFGEFKYQQGFVEGFKIGFKEGFEIGLKEGIEIRKQKDIEIGKKEEFARLKKEFDRIVSTNPDINIDELGRELFSSDTED